MNSDTITLPGFVDLQINGYGGVDFASPTLTEEKVIEACTAILSNGTAAFLATLVTCSPEVCQHNVSLIANAMKRSEFQGRVLGIHLEGPFISGKPGYVGAHEPQHVRPPDPSLFRQMQEWAQGSIRLLTIAAEIPGAEELTRTARELGIAVSVGHSAFDHSDLARVAEAGATAVTHLGNAIPNELPRHANPIWAGLSNDHITAMIIADGHHLPDELLRVFLRVKGVERTVVVSDLCPIAGLPPGEYTCFGSQVVLEESGRVSLPDRNCLAASGCTMLMSMNHLASLGLLTPEELIAVGFHNPLRLIGVDASVVWSERAITLDPSTLQFSLVSP